MISNEFAFSNYILIYLSKLKAPAAAVTLSDDDVTRITRMITEAATKAATEAATKAAKEAVAAASPAAGEFLNLSLDFVLQQRVLINNLALDTL